MLTAFSILILFIVLISCCLLCCLVRRRRRQEARKLKKAPKSSVQEYIEAESFTVSREHLQGTGLDHIEFEGDEIILHFDEDDNEDEEY